MNIENRHQAIALLTEVWDLSADTRLGQLSSHLGFLGETYVGHGLAEIDDEDLIAMMQRHREELLRRIADPVVQI